MTKRADGRYVRSLTDRRSGRRIYFYGSSEREVLHKILEYEEERRTGKAFCEVAGDWWATAQTYLASQSVKSYRAPYLRAVDHFGTRSVSDIKTRDITAYLRLVNRDRASEKTLKKHKSVLNLIFTHAITEGYIDANPCQYAQLPKGDPGVRRSSATSRDEEIVRSTTDGVWLFPFFCLMTGMRKGEILALKWSDVDFASNRISVTKSVYHEGDRPHIKEPKTRKGSRVVPLLAPLRDVLLGVDERPPDRLIFSDDGEKPLTSRRYITLYKKYQEQTGITCTAHQLRHSFATIAFESGVPDKSVQEILGHKNIATTMDIYTSFRDRAITDAADLLNANFGAKTGKK